MEDITEIIDEEIDAICKNCNGSGYFDENNKPFVIDTIDTIGILGTRTIDIPPGLTECKECDGWG